jgi:hypothetical protein
VSALAQLSTERTRRDIEDCFRKWGIEEYRFPRNGQKGEYGDALILFYVNDDRHELKCSRFTFYRENLRALFLALDALRKAHDRGILEEYARAAIAFLPAPKQEPTRRPWYEVFQVAPNADPDVVKAVYQSMAKRAHPDAGGTDEEMAAVNQAWDSFEAERAKKG